ncbi:type II secretion system protein [bacterium]|nr:type II secretion system protein [bacterium]
MKKRSGFTLLELIIALAIGALITSTVLLSAQGAERSQRDTRRRADVNKLSTALEQWADNNSGKYPVWGTDWSGTAGRFVSEGYWKAGSINDPRPNGGNYSYAYGDPTCTNISSTENAKIFYKNSNAGSPRDFTLKMCIEGGVYTLTSSQ